jgi:hypothetical protein
MTDADSACLRHRILNNDLWLILMSTSRFTLSHPCPVCGGHDGLARGRGLRCFGYLDGSGRYARCTREEHADRLLQNRDGTYSHRLDGPCRCGRLHGDAPDSAARTLTVRTRARRLTQQRFRSYFTLRAFLTRYYGDGTVVTPWIYRGNDGTEAFRVLRIDYRAPDGSTAKSYRPCHEAADGRWLLARPEGKLPLYNLPGILATPPEAIIVLLEGEKCSDLATSLGLAYVTASAHGAKAPQLTDWSPLAGRNVAILPDITGRRDAGLTDADILAELRALIAPFR